jgi:glycine/D-amino acid oxidase-like deaminating enzyme
VIGVNIAYFLIKKKPTLEITLVEKSSVACGASGRAGGFLAHDWCQGALSPLGNKSFELHKELSKELNGTLFYGYRPVQTLSLRSTPKQSHSPEVPSWIDPGSITKREVIGTTHTTAQLHPYLFTTTLLKTAETLGVKLRIGTAKGFRFNSNNTVTGVLVDEDYLDCDAVVIAMGPWSGEVTKWFNGKLTVPIKSYRTHSIILSPKMEISAHCLFTYVADGTSATDIEIYPRPDGTIYICGQTDETPLPDDPGKIVPNPESCLKLKKLGGVISPVIKNAEIIKEQVCYLPISGSGMPILGRLMDGVYIATGHSCWGILNAPVTGLAMSELIIDGKANSVDLSHFKP